MDKQKRHQISYIKNQNILKYPGSVGRPYQVVEFLLIKQILKELVK